MITPDDPRIQEIIDAAESKAQAIDGLLELGVTKGQIIKLGYAESTVRKQIDKRKSEGKDIPGTPPHEGPLFPAVTRGTESVLPEYMTQEIAQYFDGSPEQQKIFAAGIMVPLLGMRLFGEMVKPLTMLINSMKSDQMDAMMKTLSLGQEQAHTAAMESAQMVAAQMAQSQKEAAIAGSKNPMQAMMVNAMQPMFTGLMNRVMNTFMPGMAGSESTTPPGWTKTQKES